MCSNCLFVIIHKFSIIAVITSQQMPFQIPVKLRFMNYLSG